MTLTGHSCEVEGSRRSAPLRPSWLAATKGLPFNSASPCKTWARSETTLHVGVLCVHPRVNLWDVQKRAVPMQLDGRAPKVCILELLFAAHSTATDAACSLRRFDLRQLGRTQHVASPAVGQFRLRLAGGAGSFARSKLVLCWRPPGVKLDLDADAFQGRTLTCDLLVSGAPNAQVGASWILAVLVVQASPPVEALQTTVLPSEVSQSLPLTSSVVVFTKRGARRSTNWHAFPSALRSLHRKFGCLSLLNRIHSSVCTGLPGARRAPQRQMELVCKDPPG